MRSEKEDGGPAYPVPGLQHDEDFNGMSLRDYFAAKAMQGWVSDCRMRFEEGQMEEAAQFAYAMADSMLAARKRP